MRYAQRDRVILYCAPKTEGPKSKIGEPIEAYGAPVKFSANLQSASGQAAAAEYGPRLPYTMRLYGASALLEEGMGVWVDVAIGEAPDYEVIAVQQTAQSRGVTIGRRGAAGG